MKVTRCDYTQPPPIFKPICIQINLETQEEYDSVLMLLHWPDATSQHLINKGPSTSYPSAKADILKRLLLLLYNTIRKS